MRNAPAFFLSPIRYTLPVSYELFLDKEALLCYIIMRYQGVAGANAQHIPSVRDLSPGFVRSSKTFTTASVVVKVFFICFSAIMQYTGLGGLNMDYELDVIYQIFPRNDGDMR